MATQQTTTVVASKRWNIDWRDLTNGAIMAITGAVGGQIVDIASQWISTPGWGIDIHLVNPTIKGAAIAVVGYLIKKFTERSKIIITNPTEKVVEQVKEGTSVKVGTTTITNNTALETK